MGSPIQVVINHATGHVEALVIQADGPQAEGFLTMLAAWLVSPNERQMLLRENHKISVLAYKAEGATTMQAMTFPDTHLKEAWHDDDWWETAMDGYAAEHSDDPEDNNPNPYE